IDLSLCRPRRHESGARAADGEIGHWAALKFPRRAADPRAQRLRPGALVPENQEHVALVVCLLAVKHGKIAVRTVSGCGRAAVARVPGRVRFRVSGEGLPIVMRHHREEFPRQETGADVTTLVSGKGETFARLSIQIPHWRECLAPGARL